MVIDWLKKEKHYISYITDGNGTTAEATLIITQQRLKTL